MRLPNRSGNDHETLVFLELVAVPVAILTAFFTLAFAELVFAAVSRGISAAGGGGAVPGFVSGAIALGTLLVLVTGAGLLVAGYRCYFDSRFDEVDPRPVLLVPVIGLVVSIGYAIWDGGSLRLSSWLFFPVAIAATALAYRTIAVDSLRRDRRLMGPVAGALTGLPAVVALVDLASRMLDPELPVATTLDAIVAASRVPTERSVVIAVPLLVTVLYGAETLYRTQSRWDGPDWSIPELRKPILDLVSRDRTDPSSRQPTGASAAGLSGKSARSSDSSSPRSSASRNRSGISSDVVPSSPGPGPSDRGGSSSAGEDESTSSAESAGEATTDERSSSDRGEGATTAASEAAGATADSGTDDSSSDTRIFVDDFDQYGPDETPVEVCPDCDEEIPSDGVYNFCPFCGGEL